MIRIPAPLTPQLKRCLIGIWTQACEARAASASTTTSSSWGETLLAATQLLSRVREAEHVEIPFSRFFDAPTVAGIAKYIETTGRTASVCRRHPCDLYPGMGHSSLSYPQQRLWFLEHLGSQSAMPIIFWKQCVYVALCRRSSGTKPTGNDRRHEVFVRRLSTLLSNRSGYWPQPPFSPAGGRSAGLLQRASERCRCMHWRRQTSSNPFDLAQGPLLRATLVRLTDMEHVLLLTMHHIVSDGWSQEVFWRELAVLYEAFTTGQPSPLPALPIQYADFAHWQQQWLQGEVTGRRSLLTGQHSLLGYRRCSCPPTIRARPCKPSGVPGTFSPFLQH